MTLRDRRRLRVLRYNDESSTPDLLGIDFVDVLDEEDCDVAATHAAARRTLLVKGVAAWPATGLVLDHVRITGGSRIRTVSIDFLGRLDSYLAGPTPTEMTTEEAQAIQDYVDLLAEHGGDQTYYLVIHAKTVGDDSPYTLSFVRPGETTAPTGFDPVLRSIPLSFAATGVASTDPVVEEAGGTETEESPDLDYLSKDFASFRQLMLDRMSVTLPNWDEPSVADLGHTVVDVLAYAADHLSYQQDAAANEAYLHTARLRSSIRRHARLLDYRMHDGNNARAWVAFAVGSDATPIAEGTVLLTSVPDQSSWIDEADLEEVLVSDPVVFETMTPLTGYVAWNEATFYDWAGSEAVLPEGTTSATLALDAPHADAVPYVGQVWILEQVRSPTSGRQAEADPARRHAVRLTAVEGTLDPIDASRTLWRITWHAEDALPFDVELGPAEAPNYALLGNVVLADHGRTRSGDTLTPEQASERRYRPRMPEADITFAVSFDAATAATESATATLVQDPRAATPRISLTDAYGALWLPLPDLLGSDAYDRGFVVEVGGDGIARLRFGDDDHGASPAEGAVLTAAWRQGNGVSGNVGAEAIRHIVASTNPGVTLRNPLAAQGGTDMESIDDVRRFAPHVHRDSHRAVRSEDYVSVLEDRDDVQSALVSKRWTGSWWIVSLTVDRAGEDEVDDTFVEELEEYLDSWRMMGVEIEIRGPRYVGLDIVLHVEFDSDYPEQDVLAALRAAFSSTDNRDGTQGFFHPDRHTFGETLYLSKIVAHAMSVTGVQRVYTPDGSGASTDPVFRRHDDGEGTYSASLSAAGDEIFRCDCDPDDPENGSIDFVLSEGS